MRMKKGMEKKKGSFSKEVCRVFTDEEREGFLYVRKKLCEEK